VDMHLQYADKTTNGLLSLNNTGSQTATIEISDHAYGAARLIRTITAGSTATVKLPFGKSKGWYDFSVKIKGHENFEKRYAGRIETGEDSISDPYMGRVNSHS